jgi:beta-glucosidase
MIRPLLLCVAMVTLASCDASPRYSPTVPPGLSLGAALPPGFLLGTATAAHQIEGGLSNDWTDWEASSYPDGRPHIRDRDTSQIGDGSWTRWPQDIAALRHLGANAYRFSIEWSRLEPEDGVWDPTAIANYRAQLEALHAAGITPVVTLYHFTFPKWVAAKGGWEWRDPQRGVVEAMAEFAAKLGDEYGDLVDLWCTVNEPNVIAFESYLWGEYPPGAQDITRMAYVYLETMKAHAKMTDALRAHDKVDADADGHPTLVGLAVHTAIMEPASANTLDTALAGLTDDITNELIPRAVATGRVRLDVPGTISIDEEVPGLKGSFDYLGINYYTRYFVRFDLSDPSLSKQFWAPGHVADDLGFERYPEGLYRFLVRMGRWGWPIYVLENGVADAAGDSRPEFLRAHLWALEQAAATGVDVRGYFYWTLADNFEWNIGYFARNGLFKVELTDPELERRPTQAVQTFQQIASEMGLTPAP